MSRKTSAQATTDSAAARAIALSKLRDPKMPDYGPLIWCVTSGGGGGSVPARGPPPPPPRGVRGHPRYHHPLCGHAQRRGAHLNPPFRTALFAGFFGCQQIAQYLYSIPNSLLPSELPAAPPKTQFGRSNARRGVVGKRARNNQPRFSSTEGSGRGWDFPNCVSMSGGPSRRLQRT